jgi:hypothetical protein
VTPDPPETSTETHKRPRKFIIVAIPPAKTKGLSETRPEKTDTTGLKRATISFKQPNPIDSIFRM